MNRFTLLSAPLLLLAVAASACAQDVPFNRYREGEVAPAGAVSGNTLIRSQAELRQAGLESLIPTGTSFDFGAESLVALVMQDQSSGGISIGVESIELTGSQPTLEVKVRVRRPGLGVVAPTGITRPYALVRIAATTLPARFVDAGPSGPGGLLPPSQMPFHLVAEGTQADFSLTSGQFLIWSASELASSGLASLVPSPNSIRWDQEMLAILLMDVKTQAGYSVAVQRVVQRTTPFVAPGGALGVARHLEIQYETTSPTPGGSPGATVMNRPFQVVRLPRASRAVFEEVVPTPPSFIGTVRVYSALGSPTLVVLESGTERLYVTPASFAQGLAQLNGYTVTIEADRNPSVPGVLVAKSLIHPAPFSGEGVVQGSLTFPTLAAPGYNLRIKGPLASTLAEGAMTRLVRGVEGFRFRDGRLLATKFRATARQATTVTLGGSGVNNLLPGEAVIVTGRSRSGRSLLVEPTQGPSGYVAVGNLILGIHPAHPTPPATPSSPPSTGVTGALSGASGL